MQVLAVRRLKAKGGRGKKKREKDHREREGCKPWGQLTLFAVFLGLCLLTPDAHHYALYHSEYLLTGWTWGILCSLYGEEYSLPKF